MRIAIDIDDVIIDLVPAWLARYEQLTGEHVEYSSITSWDLTRFVQDPVLFYSLLNPPNRLYDLAEPVKDAGLAISRLILAGHEVVYITALADESKADWLVNLGYIKSFRPLDPRLVIASNKSIVNADMIIDDRAENVVRYPNGGIIFARPWNDIKLWPVNVERLGSWLEILDFLGIGG